MSLSSLDTRYVAIRALVAPLLPTIGISGWFEPDPKALSEALSPAIARVSKPIMQDTDSFQLSALATYLTSKPSMLVVDDARTINWGGPPEAKSPRLR